MGIIEQITGVWTDMMDWITGSFASIESLFYNAQTGLTLMGILAVAALGLSIFFLVLGIIRKFLGFRG